MHRRYTGASRCCIVPVMPQQPARKMFLHRIEWANGDVSFVMARNKYGAMSMVEGLGEPVSIERTRTFMAHFAPCAQRQEDGTAKMGWYLETFGPDTIQEMPDEATVYKRRKGLEEVVRDPATGRWVDGRVNGPPPSQIDRVRDPVTGMFIGKPPDKKP